MHCIPSYLNHFFLSECVVEFLAGALEVLFEVESGGLDFDSGAAPNVQALHVFGAQLVDDGGAGSDLGLWAFGLGRGRTVFGR